MRKYLAFIALPFFALSASCQTVTVTTTRVGVNLKTTDTLNAAVTAPCTIKEALSTVDALNVVVGHNVLAGLHETMTIADVAGTSRSISGNLQEVFTTTDSAGSQYSAYPSMQENLLTADAMSAAQLTNLLVQLGFPAGGTLTVNGNTVTYSAQTKSITITVGSPTPNSSVSQSSVQVSVP